MERRMLYITCDNEESYSGGKYVNKRNYESLVMILGKDRVSTYIIQPSFGLRTYKAKLKRLRDVFKLFGGGLKTEDVDQILFLLQDGDYTDVFIDSSALGVLAEKIKRFYPHICVYVYFHNVEYDFMVSTTWGGGDYKHLFWIGSAKHNEQCASKYADKIFTLNQKDYDRVLSLYGRASTIIPVTMKDDYHDLDERENQKVGTPLQGLFVGSYFAGNIMGLKQFCKEVLPSLNMHLTIVGSGMDKFRYDIIESDKTTIHGKAEDLTPYYESADFVILPIVSGGGMKVKTAEALKYGKYIIGTKEALEGYDLNENVAAECNTKQAFIDAVNNYSRAYKYCAASRNIFKHTFSFDSSLALFKNEISGL